MCCLLATFLFELRTIHVNEDVRERSVDTRCEADDPTYLGWPLPSWICAPGFVNRTEVFVQPFRRVLDVALQQIRGDLSYSLPVQRPLDGSNLRGIPAGDMRSAGPPLHDLRDVQGAQTVVRTSAIGDERILRNNDRNPLKPVPADAHTRSQPLREICTDL